MLDELECTHVHPSSPRAKHQAERRRGLALAVPGVDYDKTLVNAWPFYRLMFLFFLLFLLFLLFLIGHWFLRGGGWIAVVIET